MNPHKIVITLPESDGKNTDNDHQLATLAFHTVNIALRGKFAGHAVEIVTDEES